MNIKNIQNNQNVTIKIVVNLDAVFLLFYVGSFVPEIITERFYYQKTQ